MRNRVLYTSECHPHYKGAVSVDTDNGRMNEENIFNFDGFCIE